MNEKEQKAADALLQKLAESGPESASGYASAYQALMQGVLNRVNSEPRPHNGAGPTQ